MVGHTMLILGTQQADISPQFYIDILPEVKEQLKTLDRQTYSALFNITFGAAQMQLQDNELWEIIE
jgi:hypothetical protein